MIRRLSAALTRAATLLPVMVPAVLVLAITVLATSPALAHAILTVSTPAPNGSLPSGHRTLDLQYNSRIDHARSRLVLTGPSGKAGVLRVLPGSAVNALDAEADLIPGAYTLRWQALAQDGHITRGDVPFTVISAAPAR